MGFWDGFKNGFNSVIDVGKKIPVLGEIYKPIPRLHNGGKVSHTGNFRLAKGEVVLNKTQLSKLKHAKTAKTKQSIINEVKKRRPKKMKRGYK
jgi:hypothetical protein